jgi:phenylacetate-CoA ligase
MSAAVSPLFANAPSLINGSAGRLPESLEGEIRRIYGRSPLYSKRFLLHSDPLHWSCYREIPALSKKDIVTHGHEAFFDDYRVV